MSATIGSNGVLGLPSNARTITVNPGIMLQVEAPNIFGQFYATNVPTLVINGGVVTNADPTNSGAINNALNNVTLNGGTLTATTGEREPVGPGYGAGTSTARSFRRVIR